MAFASTITGYGKWMDKRVVYGKWTTDTTGGDINTGLLKCEFITLQATGSAVHADAPTVNETLPAAGNAITIVCTNGDDGDFMAIGY